MNTLTNHFCNTRKVVLNSPSTPHLPPSTFPHPNHSFSYIIATQGNKIKRVHQKIINVKD